uniref:Uncharacterized protein n=1 Tax=Klebsiella pneumoniae TaxID=573 RepID=L0ARI4_KLEPN|nr:hypothetical protein [Klebsiella pneumoniae]
MNILRVYPANESYKDLSSRFMPVYPQALCIKRLLFSFLFFKNLKT